MQRVRPFLPAVLVSGVALCVRILYNVTVARAYVPAYDSAQYQQIGLHLIDEHCFCLHPFITTAYRPPLWPMLIAALSLPFGRADIYARLFLCGLGAGTCLLLFLFARDLFGRRSGLVAGLSAALFPTLFIYDGWLYTEALYTFLLLALCLCLLHIQRSQGRRTGLWLLCGVLLALLALTRPNGLLLLGLLWLWTLWLLWRKRLHTRALRNAALATAIACVLIGPWTLRNYLLTQRFLPVATGDGTVLLGAYNDEAATEPANLGSWINPLKSAPEVLTLFPLFTCNAPCEMAREDAAKNAAIQWISGHVSALPRLLVYHLRNFWTPYTREADLPMERFPDLLASKVVLVLSRTLPLPLFALAALGLFVTLRQRRELLFVYALLLTTMGEALIYYGISRFRAPIEPLLILLATGALCWHNPWRALPGQVAIAAESPERAGRKP
ncbi:MAG TPA: glycosyltransferase family 39 protein [Ktedonobacteraceae bacterium]|jgi:4-amino-4-deoxy-L-arabinose transferase-like glycosyltransferase